MLRTTQISRYILPNRTFLTFGIGPRKEPLVQSKIKVQAGHAGPSVQPVMLRVSIGERTGNLLTFLNSNLSTVIRAILVVMEDGPTMLLTGLLSTTA